MNKPPGGSLSIETCLIFSPSMGFIYCLSFFSYSRPLMECPKQYPDSLVIWKKIEERNRMWMKKVLMLNLWDLNLFWRISWDFFFEYFSGRKMTWMVYFSMSFESNKFLPPQMGKIENSQWEDEEKRLRDLRWKRFFMFDTIETPS